MTDPAEAECNAARGAGAMVPPLMWVGAADAFSRPKVSAPVPRRSIPTGAVVGASRASVLHHRASNASSARYEDADNQVAIAAQGAVPERCCDCEVTLQLAHADKMHLSLQQRCGRLRSRLLPVPAVGDRET
jgi:hypothetical protein